VHQQALARTLDFGLHALAHSTKGAAANPPISRRRRPATRTASALPDECLG
jgi:hypothetical protein